MTISRQPRQQAVAHTAVALMVVLAMAAAVGTDT
jgi:hypothetical protein